MDAPRYNHIWHYLLKQIKYMYMYSILKSLKKKDEFQDVKLTPVSGMADILPISFVIIYQIKLHSFVLFKAIKQ